MPLAKDVPMELEPPKTPETPTPTSAFPIHLPSSPDPQSEERSDTIRRTYYHRNEVEATAWSHQNVYGLTGQHHP
jgi:hypothetical protein